MSKKDIEESIYEIDVTLSSIEETVMRMDSDIKEINGSLKTAFLTLQYHNAVLHGIVNGVMNGMAQAEKLVGEVDKDHNPVAAGTDDNPSGAADG